MANGTHYLRISDITDRIPVSRTTIYRLMRKSEFPKSIRVGSSSLWIESEIAEWENERRSARE